MVTSESPSPTAAQVIDLEGVARPSRGLFAEAMQRLFRNKASVFGLVLIAIFVFVGLNASWVAPMDPLKIHDGQGYLPPAWSAKGDPRYLLGTDTLGRDVLSRVIYGARISMVVGFVPTVIILLVGATVGMIAGFFGGRLDNILMRFTDVIYAFPDLLFFIIIMVALRDAKIGRVMNGLLVLFVALAIVNWVGVARLVRGQVLSLKEKEFIEAARSIGAKNSRIMLKHLLPNTLGPLTVSAAFLIPGMIITEATLGYLGVGVRPATSIAAYFVTSWGAIMLEGQAAINAQKWILLAPAICVALTVLSFTFLGDGLRDALDPRMRGTK